MNATIRHMLDEKGTHVHTIESHATIQAALERLATEDIGALVVLEDGQAVGIFSERDYARKIEIKGRKAKDVRVREAMTHPLVVASPHWTARTCLALMTHRRVRHLPVRDGDRLVGLVSIGDVVKSVISDQAFVIEQLEAYVVGGPVMTNGTGPAVPPPL